MINWQQELSKDTKVKVVGCDMDGIARGKIMSVEKFLKIQSSGFGFCDVVFGWDCQDKVYTTQTNTSFVDILALPDLSTYRRLPWESNIPFFLLDFYDPASKSLLSFAPRSLLKSVSAQLHNKHALTAMCGMEYEWYNFKEDPESIQASKGVGLKPLTPGMFGYSITRPLLYQSFFEQIYDHCRAFGIPIEGIHTETGPGVYEVALEYADALTLADRSHLFKTCVKQIASLHGITSCFMAKPHPNLPGCSGHIHFSLRSKEGKNAFEQTKDGVPCETMKKCLAGILKGLPSIMAIFGPTINSYKRLVENYWAPVTVSYGFENRTTALRIIAPPTCEPSATRIEVRVPGADGNFYGCLHAS